MIFYSYVNLPKGTTIYGNFHVPLQQTAIFDWGECSSSAEDGPRDAAVSWVDVEGW